MKRRSFIASLFASAAAPVVAKAVVAKRGFRVIEFTGTPYLNYVECRKFQVEEIARIFQVPASKLIANANHSALHTTSATEAMR